MDGDSERHVSRQELRAAFDHELATNTLAAAETAYALAFRYRNEDVQGQRRFDLARKWATRSIELLDSLPSATLTDVASTRVCVGGVEVPDLLHTDVVRERLGDVLTH